MLHTRVLPQVPKTNRNFSHPPFETEIYNTPFKFPLATRTGRYTFQALRHHARHALKAVMCSYGFIIPIPKGRLALAHPTGESYLTVT